MSGETSTVRFRLAGWVGELATRDRRLARDVRELFYEPAAPGESADASYRAFVDRRFGAQKRHWLSGPDSDRFLRITPFYPSLLEAVAASATSEAAAFQKPGRQPLIAGAVSGSAGALILLGRGGLRPRLMQALARSGFPFRGDGLAVVEPKSGRLIPCARAIAITRPAHTLTAHGRGDRPFRNRERTVHRYVLPEHRHPTGEDGACPLGALVHVREGDEARIRPMPRGEALLVTTEHCLGEEGSAFENLVELVDRVPAYELSVPGTKRAIEVMRTELPELAEPARGDVPGEATV